MNQVAPPVLKLYPYGYGDPREAPPTAPRAAYYDLASRQILRDSSGVYAMQMHPIDQALALICGMQLGSLRCLPTLGINYAVLDGVIRSKWAATLDAEVRRALNTYLSRGDISLDPVTIVDSELATQWSLEWTATYTNNRLPTAKRGTVSVIGGRY